MNLILTSYILLAAAVISYTVRCDHLVVNRWSWRIARSLSLAATVSLVGGIWLDQQALFLGPLAVLVGGHLLGMRRRLWTIESLTAGLGFVQIIGLVSLHGLQPFSVVAGLVTWVIVGNVALVSLIWLVFEVIGTSRINKLIWRHEDWTRFLARRWTILKPSGLAK
jgi:hypothetical protein